MKISDKTVKILQNFATINQGIVFNPGRTIRTIIEDGSGSVFAEATIDETLEHTFGVYDLKKLLNLLSLSKNPDLSVTDTHLKIKGDKSVVSLRHTNTKLIKTPPDLNIVTTYFVTFPMSVLDLKWVFNTSTILGTKHIAFRGENGKLTCDVSDVEGRIVDEGSLELGATEHTFKAVLLVDKLKLVSGDYDVSISNRGALLFSSKNTKLKYWISLLKEPSQLP